MTAIRILAGLGAVGLFVLAVRGYGRRQISRLNLIILFVLCASVVALALPDLYAEFDTTIVGVSWVLTSYALVVAVTAVPVALLHRRVRPQPPAV